VPPVMNARLPLSVCVVSGMRSDPGREGRRREKDGRERASLAYAP
jgi:hypothetical protein